MSFNPKQFREVICCTLADFGEKYSTDAAIELLMMTAAAESDLGSYLYQDDGDAEIEQELALGVFQVESMTFYDVLKRVIQSRYPGFPCHTFTDLITDIRLGIVIARFKYWSIPEALPRADNVRGLARYYKRYYNTPNGKARTGDVIRKYEQLCF